MRLVALHRLLQIVIFLRADRPGLEWLGGAGKLVASPLQCGGHTRHLSLCTRQLCREWPVINLKQQIALRHARAVLKRDRGDIPRNLRANLHRFLRGGAASEFVVFRH